MNGRRSLGGGFVRLRAASSPGRYTPSTGPYEIVRPVAAAVPTVGLALAALVGLLGTLSARALPVEVLAPVLPVDDLSADPLLTAVTGVGLIALALGLRRGKRLAWWLALVTFVSALIAQLALFGHVVGAAMAALCLFALALDRRRFVVATTRTWRARGVMLAILGGVAIALETSLVLVSQPGTTVLAGASDAGASLADSLSFGGADPALRLAGHGLLIAALLVLARLPMTLAAIGILAPAGGSRVDAPARGRALEVLRRSGRGALLPFQLAPDKDVWIESQGGLGDGVVVYGRAGRYSVLVGDPVGPPPAAWRAFQSFVGSARERDEIVAVYQASEAGRTMLEAAGYRTFRIGHEAILELSAFDLAGSRRANLRHTVGRARRGGISVIWRPHGLDPDELRRLGPGLASIDAAWRATSGPPMGFTIGAFDPAELPSLPIAIALDADDRPSAFVTFRSTGRDGGMVLDLMRRSPGGVPGSLESCLAEAADGMRADGVTTLSLGLAPLAGLDRPEATVEERALAVAARLVRPWYDVRGLEFFKSKFDPRWEPRYVAVRRRLDLIGLSVALLRLHLGGFRRVVGATVRDFLGRLPATVRPRPAAIPRDEARS